LGRGGATPKGGLKGTSWVEGWPGENWCSYGGGKLVERGLGGRRARGGGGVRPTLGYLGGGSLPEPWGSKGNGAWDGSTFFQGKVEK